MLKIDISGMLHLARTLDIPFWEFELATGTRQTIQYPDMELEELAEYKLRVTFQLPDTDEQTYAIQMKLIKTLEELASKAETDEEVAAVIRHLPSYYIPASDTAWEKRLAKVEPERLLQHKRLLRLEFAKRDAELSCCETAEEVLRLCCRHMIAQLPWYDTHTEKAFLQLIEMTEDIDILKEVRERSLVWHQSRLASVRKIAALTKYVNRGL
jgi:hypothetical protein